MELIEWQRYAAPALEAPAVDRVNDVIARGHAALAQAGPTPIVVTIDSLLLLAAAHLVAHDLGDTSTDHLGWARLLGSYAADRSVDLPPAAALLLASRAECVLRLERSVRGELEPPGQREQVLLDRVAAYGEHVADALDEVVALRAAVGALSVGLSAEELAHPDVGEALREAAQGGFNASLRAGAPALAESFRQSS